MSIISKTDFLENFPMFGGLDDGSITSAITQAESEYDTSLPNWLPITLNLIAHILTARSLGVAMNVQMMGTTNGTSSIPNTSPNYHWKGTSLQSTPFGQEVSRLLAGTVGGGLFI